MQAMILPESVEEWTLSLIEALVEADYFETDTFDFKEFLVNKQDPQHKLSIRKTTCAFANSRGGFIVFGVADRNSGKTGRGRIVGIERKLDMAKCFGDQIKLIEPTVLYVPQNPPMDLPDTGRAIFVVHIPRSQKAPHAFQDDERYWFYKRTNQGNKPMSYAEIEEAFTLKNQFLGKLALMNLQLLSIESLLPRLYAEELKGKQKTQWSYPLAKPDCGLLDILISDLYPVIGNNSDLLSTIAGLKMACMAVSSLIEQLPIELMIRGKAAVEGYNKGIRSRVPIIQNLITKVRQILREQYGIQEMPLVK